MRFRTINGQERLLLAVTGVYRKSERRDHMHKIRPIQHSKHILLLSLTIPISLKVQIMVPTHTTICTDTVSYGWHLEGGEGVLSTLGTFDRNFGPFTRNIAITCRGYFASLHDTFYDSAPQN